MQPGSPETGMAGKCIHRMVRKTIEPRHKAGGSRPFYSQLVTATIARLLLNTARRFVYPFAPALSRGLNVPLSAITSIIAVFQASALLGFLIGPLTDRWGYRRMMLAGMWMTALGLLVGALFPHYFWVMAGLFYGGIGQDHL